MLIKISLRLLFEVANGPNDFSLVNPIIDITNDILQDPSWEPTKTYALVCAHFNYPKHRQTDNTPMGTAWKLMVHVPYHPEIADGYIDDVIIVMIDDED